MSQIQTASPDVLLLLSRLCDNTASQDDLDSLEAALGGDDRDLELFLDYLQLHSDLHFEVTSRTLSSEALQGIGVPSVGEDAGNSSPSPIVGTTEPSYQDWVAESQPCVLPSSLPSFSPAIFPSTGSYFSSGWPVAYLAATMILGIGLLIGALTPVSEPEHFARHSVLPSTFGRGAGGEGNDHVAHSRSTVGRITGMVDCRWDQGSEIRDKRSEDDSHPSSLIPHPSSPVSLGDKFALASGLLEVTYNSGAKVILQGPLCYEAESNGGYLSLGKLTGKLEKGGEQSPNLQISKSPNRFVIKTLTAIVTDLGTEFGVEVTKDGANQVHVFQGRVELVRVHSGVQTAAPEKIRLAAGESLRLSRAGHVVDRPTVSASAGDFIRQMPTQELPRRLAGLRLWLRADAGVFKDDAGKTPALPGESIACWADQSDHGANAVQRDSRSRPRLAIGPAGKPVVRFDGIDDVLSLPELGLPGGCTVVALAGNHGDGDFFVLLGQHQGDAIAPHWAGSSRFVYDVTADKSALARGPDFGDHSYRVFSIRKFAEGGRDAVTWHTDGLRDSLSQTQILSGDVLKFNEVGARTWNGTPSSPGGQLGKQDIAELIVFDRDVSDAERRAVEAYLKQKYQVPERAQQ